jgi:transcriptional activator SPT7
MPATAIPPAPTSTSTLPTMSVTAPPSQTPSLSLTPTSTVPAAAAGVQVPSLVYPPPNPDLNLPDDGPSPAQVKMGPIGQIIKPGNAAAAAKKKAPPALPKGGVDGAAAGAGSGAIVVPAAGPVNGLGDGTPVAERGGGSVEADSGSQSPSKKRKLNAGVGTGNGRKKKPEGGGVTTGLPPVVIASA